VLRILWRAKAPPNTDLDLPCYTPEEFEKKKEEIGIVREEPQSMGNSYNSLRKTLPAMSPPHPKGGLNAGPELPPPGHLAQGLA